MKGILVALVVILGLGLALESAYLLKLRRRLLCQRLAGQVMGQHEQSQRRAIKRQALPAQVEEDDPFAEMRHFQQRARRMFYDDFLEFHLAFRPRLAVKAVIFEPQLNIKDTEGAYLVIVDLPGMKKGDIKVEADGRYLSISGARKIEESAEDKGYFRQELGYGSFLRTVALPDDAKLKEASSEYRDGVLTVRVPKDKIAKAQGGAVRVEIK